MEGEPGGDSTSQLSVRSLVGHLTEASAGGVYKVRALAKVRVSQK